MKTKNKLTVFRVVSLSVLIFCMNFLPDMIGITEGGDFPTAVQMSHSLLVGTMQVCVMLYALLERDHKQEENHAKELEGEGDGEPITEG